MSRVEVHDGDVRKTRAVGIWIAEAAMTVVFLAFGTLFLYPLGRSYGLWP